MNKVILIGRLTADPEVRQTQSGENVSSFSIAVDRRFSKERKADFINCVAWGNTCNFLNKFFRKGNRLAVIGRLETRSWEDKQGNKRYSTEVTVEEIEFVESKSEASKPHTNDSGFTEVGDDDFLPF